MKSRKTLLAASIAASLYASAFAYAADPAAPAVDPQQAPADSKKTAEELGTVVVTGIRNTEEASLRLKQAYDSHVEIVTSEDVGKLPAKNVADSLQRLPGINIASASASEGGFDENDRVSIRGTAPSLTQTLINGHSVGTGDWFVLSQVQTIGRSVSYLLLPSEIVSEVVVHKSSEAKIVEGSAAGTVDIRTRKPLEYSKPLTVEASVGGVYSDLPGDTEPQFSGLVNWKNADNTFGVMFQAFYEKRSLQRNGQEVVNGYQQIQATDQIAKDHPDLAGKYYPDEIGSVYFTQKRERKGGVFDIQYKPTDDLSFDLNGFFSKLKADNYNRNYMEWGSHSFMKSGAGLQSYKVDGNLITAANFAPVPGSTDSYGVYDMISRPGASSQTQFLTAEAKWRTNDHLSFTGQVGTTKGKGDSPEQNVLEVGTQAGAGASWQMQGLGRPINWNLGGDNTTPSNVQLGQGWIFGDQNIHVTDKENWLQADGELAFDNSVLSSLDFGVRYAKHTRENSSDIGQGPTGDWTNPANLPGSFQRYPGDFPSTIGGSFPIAWYLTPEQLAEFNRKFANRDPVQRFNWQNIYRVEEKDTAVYLQANFTGDRWSANAGVRYVNTDQDINYNTTTPEKYTVGGPFTGSAFGPYYTSNYSNSDGKFLPSANFKFELAQDLITRFSVSQTLTRPDYSALAGSVSLDDLTHTGSGGNPQLRPIVSTNFDAALEWYFAPRGLLSAGVYTMDLKDYVNFANQVRTYKDVQASQNAGHDVFVDYKVSVPSNVGGSMKGVELNYIQPIGENFGVALNYTYANGHANDTDRPWLQGASKNTVNLSGYYEDDRFSARLTYTYRSSFYAGVSRSDSYFQQGIGNLAAAFGFKVNDWATVTLDALNLNDPKIKYYTQNPVLGKQPYAIYTNGRQYYVNLRLKF
ncbi:MAG: TonB-dependent receptor [Rudaea sp.]|nr:TonB-dependent receptor [Rudaea sp.]